MSQIVPRPRPTKSKFWLLSTPSYSDTEFHILVNLTLGRTRKFIPPPWYKGGGGVVDETPPQSYVEICCSISKRFYLQRKAFDLLNKMRYILWMVALLEDCDVTHNGRHLGCHLGFY